MTRRTRRLAMALVAGCALAGTAQTAIAHDEALTIALENDVFTGSDNSYSNGLGVTWVSGDLERYENDHLVRRWGRYWEFLPFVADDGFTTYASWTLSHEIHTPYDITIPDPPETDQPYAGVLSLDSVLYARSERWAHAWELKLGVVGPASGAAGVQRDFHALIGDDKPMGWATQLSNEPVINVGLTSAHLWREGSAGGSARWRLVPVGHVDVGTYFTGAGLGMYGEVGWNLVDALGGTSLRGGLTAASTVGVGPVDGWSVAFFAGLAGHAVAHYLPLDGNLFRESHSVDTRPFVGNASLGVSIRRGGFAFSLATAFSTKAFETQQKGAEFGTLNVSWYL